MLWGFWTNVENLEIQENGSRGSKHDLPNLIVGRISGFGGRFLGFNRRSGGSKSSVWGGQNRRFGGGQKWSKSPKKHPEKSCSFTIKNPIYSRPSRPCWSLRYTPNFWGVSRGQFGVDFPVWGGRFGPISTISRGNLTYENDPNPEIGPNWPTQILDGFRLKREIGCQTRKSTLGNTLQTVKPWPSKTWPGGLWD